MKKFLIILTVIALAAICMGVGYQAGRIHGKAKCIAAVTDNCREICGVPAEFCYPDDEDTAIEWDTTDDDLAVYRGDNG